MDKLMFDGFEEIRRYIIENDVEITCKDDLVELFVTMRDKGYFYPIRKENRMRDFRELLSKFANYYEENKRILDPGLILKGAAEVLKKLEKYQKR